MRGGGIYIEKYPNFPLKDLYQSSNIECNDLNSCAVLVDFSTDRANYERDIYPATIRIAVRLVNNTGKALKKEWLIENSLSDFLINDNKYYYINTSYVSVHKPDPFSLSTYGADTKISLKAEYDTGINEYTLYRHKKYSLIDVFDELNKLITADMNITVVVPRAKRNFSSILYACKNDHLKEKLEKSAKKKGKKL